MFESIEELEKQVEEFEKNILASKALIKSIENISTSIKVQQEDFDKKSNELLVTIEELKSSISNNINELNKNNNDLVSSTTKALTEQIVDYNTSVSVLIDGLKTTNQEQLSAVSQELSDEQKKYIQHLDEVKASLSSLESQLNEHYALFLEQLETTNISNIASEIQLLKKSLNTKFALAMAGIGIAIVLLIVSIFLR